MTARLGTTHPRWLTADDATVSAIHPPGQRGRSGQITRWGPKQAAGSRKRRRLYSPFPAPARDQKALGQAHGEPNGARRPNDCIETAPGFPATTGTRHPTRRIHPWSGEGPGNARPGPSGTRGCLCDLAARNPSAKERRRWGLRPLSTAVRQAQLAATILLAQSALFLADQVIATFSPTLNLLRSHLASKW